MDSVTMAQLREPRSSSYSCCFKSTVPVAASIRSNSARLATLRLRRTLSDTLAAMLYMYTCVH